MDTWKFWMAFGVGVAAGAAVALLYAPQPGDRTRKQIKRGLEDASDQIKSTAEDFSEKAEQYGKQAERVIRRGREVVDDTHLQSWIGCEQSIRIYLERRSTAAYS